MIKLLLAVIAAAVILLLIGITAFGILEAKSMEWETRTIRKEGDMSAYSDWKCGAITEEEYKDYCRWEDDRDKEPEEADEDDGR